MRCRLKQERLDKILAHMGFGTRSEVKKLVQGGAVLVNGQVIRDSGTKVAPMQDVIECAGQQVAYRRYIYVMLNKPRGVVSATEDARDRTVIDLLDDRFRHFQPFPVGRLDKDTEGLLLLTNDGQLAHNLLSPRKEVPKTYFAEVTGVVDERDVEAMARGIELDDGYVTLPAKLKVLGDDALSAGQGGGVLSAGLGVFGEGALPVEHGTYGVGARSRVELTIMEGKFHQVKRMFQAVGKQVVYLKRISMGGLQLDPALLPGQFRELLEKELAELLKCVK